MLVGLFDCIACSFLKQIDVGFSLSTAYQLRVCQPPPEVANADALMEDTEFEIGKMFLLFYH